MNVKGEGEVNSKSPTKINGIQSSLFNRGELVRADLLPLYKGDYKVKYKYEFFNWF